MGMAASQARFLGLTARKTNVEYEGQQVNQQRTCLANQTANYYNQLLGMTVPTPPSIADFTKTVYTFQDGNLTNSITALLAQNDGLYKASYTSNWADDFSIVSVGKTSVVNSQGTMARTVDPANNYYVGADQLKELGKDLNWAYIIREGSQKYRLTESGDNYTYTNAEGKSVTLVPATDDRITTIIGPKPNPDDYDLGPLVEDYTNTACYSAVINPGSTHPQERGYHIEHNICRLIWTDGRSSVTSSNGVTLTRTATALNGTYYSLAHNSGAQTTNDQSRNLQNALSEYFPDEYQDLIDLYVDTILLLNDVADSSHINRNLYTLSTTEYDKNQVTIDNLYTRWQNTWDTIGDLKYDEVYNRDLAEWEAKRAPYVGKFLDSQDYTKVYSITERHMYYDGSNEYLKSLSSDQLEKLYQEEVDYKDRLNELYGESENGWYVRYVKNSGTGEYEPIFYNGDDMADGVRIENGDICSHVSTYKIGTKQMCEEIKGVPARLEKDSTGRYINITLNPGTSDEVTYALTTNTLTDQAAYDDAMNQYEYDKNKYDQAIQEINTKIEIIQAQDKNLELRLKQLDTEQDAITNEMDAVQKVIEKNTESTFRTFG
ncbi:MAG: hypothetical protein E7Z93_07835 [Cyanobacteria bacterium SIG32]|nr:hypothetical protein [Cyanobacteria bacterium SIG32]